MKKLVTFLLMSSLSILLVACSSNNAEESFPSKDIKFVVHTSSGGPTDLMAREVAKAVEEVTGETVVVENKPGGSGATAMNDVFSAKMMAIH